MITILLACDKQELRLCKKMKTLGGRQR